MRNPTRHSFTSQQLWLALPYRLTTAPPDTIGVQVFLHIPKCGGTTLDYVMTACAREAGHQHWRFAGEPYDPPIWMRHGWTGAWATAAESNQDLWAHVRSVSGHVPFGLHDLAGRPCRYVTMVRDPVAREVSSYNFHYQRSYIDGRRSLLDYLAAGALLDNPQVRMLAGTEAMSGPCTEATLAQALDNIEGHFALVGLVERSDEFLSALLAINGWPPVLHPRAQITGRKLVEQPDESLQSQLREFHAFDVQLHDLVTRRWTAWRDTQVAGLASPGPSDQLVMIPPDFAGTLRHGHVAAHRVTTAGRGRVLHIAEHESV